MAELLIDRRNGALETPNGVRITSDLSQVMLRAACASIELRQRDVGTRPYVHYDFDGGTLSGKGLLVSACYYDESLLTVRLTVDQYPPGTHDWADYSMAIEAAAKQFHDQLLIRLLGKPSRGGSFLLGRAPRGMATLRRPLQWSFSWGRVNSCHDAKGGGTFISIAYGNREEEAFRLYQRTIDRRL